MNCARGFGALIELRDDPAAPIPDEFKPGEYHSKELKKAQQRLGKIRKWSAEEAEKKAAASFKKARRQYVEGLVEKNEIWHRYEEMLRKVQGWEPPTPDHVNLKEYMIEQLEQSIKFDCAYSITPPVKQSGAEYKEAQVAFAKRDVDYHIEHQREDEKRAKERTKWVRALRKSLEESPDTAEA